MSIALETPSFFLYGESPRAVERHFVHVEPLDDRTRPSEWSIEPHGHVHLHHVFLITAGAGRMFADGRSIAFAAPCVLLVPAQVVHSFRFDVDSAGLVMTIAETFFAELMLREPLFAAMFATAAVVPVAEERAVIDIALQQMRRELLWPSSLRGPMIDGALLMAAAAILRARGTADADRRPVSRRSLGLVARFRAAIDRDWSSHLSISSYARLLATSPSRLRAACVLVTGQGPHAILQGRVMLEAQRALLYSSLSVAEVGFAAGFADPAYFSRAFRQAFGCSPRAFRRSE